MSKLSALHLILTSALPAPPTLFSIGAPCFRVPPRTGPRKTGVMGRRETRVDDKPHVVYISKTTLRVMIEVQSLAHLLGDRDLILTTHRVSPLYVTLEKGFEE